MRINTILTSDNIREFDINKYELLILELAHINSGGLEAELLSHTVYFAYYNGLLARAARYLDNLIVSLDYIVSNLKNEKRKEGKASVDFLNDYANVDDTTRETQEKIAAAQETYSLIKSVCQTLEHKKDMLVQLSANQRMEAKINS